MKKIFAVLILILFSVGNVQAFVSEVNNYEAYSLKINEKGEEVKKYGHLKIRRTQQTHSEIFFNIANFSNFNEVLLKLHIWKIINEGVMSLNYLNNGQEIKILDINLIKEKYDNSLLSFNVTEAVASVLENEQEVIKFILRDENDLVVKFSETGIKPNKKNIKRGPVLRITHDASELIGPKGDTGEKGNNGVAGSQGPQGKQGPQGIQGKTGSQGSQGKTGERGIQGKKGNTGAQGPKGITGDKGDKGDDASICPKIVEIFEEQYDSTEKQVLASDYKEIITTQDFLIEKHIILSCPYNYIPHMTGYLYKDLFSLVEKSVMINENSWKWVTIGCYNDSFVPVLYCINYSCEQ